MDSLNFTVGTRVSAELRDALAFFSVQAVQSRAMPSPALPDEIQCPRRGFILPETLVLAGLEYQLCIFYL